MSDQQKIDLDELGRLAEAVRAPMSTKTMAMHQDAVARMMNAVTPEAVLALLSENATLRAERDEAVGLLREIADAPQPKNAGLRFQRALASVNAFVARLNASALQSIARETGK